MRNRTDHFKEMSNRIKEATGDSMKLLNLDIKLVKLYEQDVFDSQEFKVLDSMILDRQVAIEMNHA